VETASVSYVARKVTCPENVRSRDLEAEEAVVAEVVTSVAKKAIWLENVLLVVVAVVEAEPVTSVVKKAIWLENVPNQVVVVVEEEVASIVVKMDTCPEIVQIQKQMVAAEVEGLVVLVKGEVNLILILN